MGVARPCSVENQYSHTSVYKLVQGHKSRTGKPTELVIGNRLHEQRQVSKIPTNHTWYLCLADFFHGLSGNELSHSEKPEEQH